MRTATTGKAFFVFVEGDDEERFVRGLLTEKARAQGGSVQVIRYAHGKDRSRAMKVLATLNAAGVDYLFLGDKDSHPCFSSKKASLVADFSANSNSIVVVEPEIEGWYIAGVTPNERKKLGCTANTNLKPDRCRKQDFDSLMPVRFKDRIQFMLALLKLYDCAEAERCSRSLAYGLRKRKAKWLF